MQHTKNQNTDLAEISGGIKTKSSLFSGQQANLAIMGASIGNHCITHETVEAARIYARLAGLDLSFMVTGDLKSGGPGRWNYLALGYNIKGAQRYAKSQTRKMISQIQVEESELVNWEDIYTNPDYICQKEKLSNLMHNHKEFSDDVKKSSQDYLSRKLRNNQILSDEMILTGTQYLLEELAFMLAATSIFKRKHAAYLYHNDWPIYRKLIAGEYDGIKRKELGLIIINSNWDYSI